MNKAEAKQRAIQRIYKLHERLKKLQSKQYTTAHKSGPYIESFLK